MFNVGPLLCAGRRHSIQYDGQCTFLRFAMGLMDVSSFLIINYVSLLNMYSLKACPVSQRDLHVL